MSLGLAIVGAGCSHRVLIDSKPQGATVYVDRAEVGQTPYELEEGDQEAYQIRLEKAGFEPKEAMVMPMESGRSNCFLASPWQRTLPDTLFFELHPLAGTSPTAPRP